MKPVVIFCPANEALAKRLAQDIGGDMATAVFHRFPDRETYIRFDTPVSGRPAIIVCTLDRPDEKFLPLAFVAQTARELGARKVGLVAPYLAYMRQDKRFQAGEAVTAKIFAGLLSGLVDWLVTVEPHLHRIRALEALYRIPTRVVHAAPPIAEWIGRNVSSPLIIGPDEESAPWVEDIAAKIGAPYAVAKKLRRGDRDVELTVAGLEQWSGRTPVIVDDIISSGRTQIAMLAQLRRRGLKPAVCVAVHGIFAGDAYGALRAAEPARLVTANTITHETNGIDVIPPMAATVREMLGAEA
jgi:ribose-phosphate pyrophosphokinase